MSINEYCRHLLPQLTIKAPCGDSASSAPVIYLNDFLTGRFRHGARVWTFQKYTLHTLGRGAASREHHIETPLFQFENFKYIPCRHRRSALLRTRRNKQHGRPDIRFRATTNTAHAQVVISF